MFDIKPYPLLTGLTVFVVFESLIFNYYLNSNQVDEQSIVYGITFREWTDNQWKYDLQKKILVYFPDWDKEFGQLTKDVAHCDAKCNENSTGDQIHFDFNCKSSNPVVVYDADITEEKLKTMTEAEATIPCFLKLAQSKIPNANRGIFTKHRVPKGIVFGPYTGILLSDYGEEGDRARNGGYAWKIRRYKEDGEEDHFNIDGQHENSSNWLRWVNSARYFEEQNMIPLLFNYTVYYMTYKDVEPDTELLIWYGTQYAQKVLKIFTMKGSGHDWDNDFAPSKDIVICPTCPHTEGPVDGDDVVSAEEHHSEDLVHHPNEESEEDFEEDHKHEQNNDAKYPPNP